MIGKEIAEAIWPIAKIVGYVASAAVATFVAIRAARKHGADKANLKVLRRERDARIKFERDRSQARRDAVDRLRRIRAGMRRPDGPGGDPS